MIHGEHCNIRGAEADDAPHFHRLYTMDCPHGGLLDARREPMMPTIMELREVLARKDAGAGWFYTIEEFTGNIIGFCILRGVNYEVGFTEMTLLPLDNRAYRDPWMREAAAFAASRAFDRLRLAKLLAHCLDSETDAIRFLSDVGFVHNGAQRDAFFGRGRWHNLESFSMTAPAPSGAGR